MDSAQEAHDLAYSILLFSGGMAYNRPGDIINIPKVLNCNYIFENTRTIIIVFLHLIIHFNVDEWMNEWMKSYIAHVSSRRLFRALNIESNLARPVIIQIPTQSPGRYTAELPLRRIKLFSFQANSPYVPSTHTLWIFWGLAGWKLRLRPLRFFYVQL